jgi:hypothetical protein
MNDLTYFSKCNSPPPPVASMQDLLTTDFKMVNSSQGSAFVLGPGATIPFEIALKALRPGVFGLSTASIATRLSSFSSPT